MRRAGVTNPWAKCHTLSRDAVARARYLGLMRPLPHSRRITYAVLGTSLAKPGSKRGSCVP